MILITLLHVHASSYADMRSGKLMPTIKFIAETEEGTSKINQSLKDIYTEGDRLLNDLINDMHSTSDALRFGTSIPSDALPVQQSGQQSTIAHVYNQKIRDGMSNTNVITEIGNLLQLKQVISTGRYTTLPTDTNSILLSQTASLRIIEIARKLFLLLLPVYTGISSSEVPHFTSTNMSVYRHRLDKLLKAVQKAGKGDRATEYCGLIFPVIVPQDTCHAFWREYDLLINTFKQFFELWTNRKLNRWTGLVFSSTSTDDDFDALLRSNKGSEGVITID